MKPYQQPPVFKIGRFRFDLQAITPVRLPVFSGAALRGAFGTVFRRLFCVDRIEGDCHSCLSRSGCGYALIFATPNNPDNKAFTKNTDLTRPFVLEIENGRYFFPEGASFQVRVTLVGRSIGYLPYFIIVFQELGRAGFGIKNAQGERGKYQVKRVCQILSGKERTIYVPERNTLSEVVPEEVPVPSEEPGASSSGEQRLKVTYITPCRVKYQGSLCAEIEFHILIRNALRRISQLYYFENNKQLVLNYKGLIQKAQTVRTVEKAFRWIDFERYSTRQHSRLKMGGVVGYACYTGQFADFLWILKLIEDFHLGKGVTFGFGKIKVEAGK
jgi:hypothetical protein